MQAIDQRCIWFAEYLKCEPSLVQKSYEESGAISLLDRIAVTELNANIKHLERAAKLINEAIHELDKLSEIEKLSQNLAETVIIDDLNKITPALVSIIQSRKILKSDNDNMGGKNELAHAIAMMTIKIFESANWPITFGVNDATGKPTTNYGKAVQRALEIFDVKSDRKPITKAHPFPQYADWHAPAKATFKKHSRG